MVEMPKYEPQVVSDKMLCPKCHGDTVLKIPGGIMTCDHCNGWGEVYAAYERARKPSTGPNDPTN